MRRHELIHMLDDDEAGPGALGRRRGGRMIFADILRVFFILFLVLRLVR